MRTCFALAVWAAAATAASAADFTFESTTQVTEWKVSRGGKPVMVYAFDPGRFKPYVKELRTVTGDNLLRDAPFDHLHHHALMYAIRVNGLNFWEEVPGSGVQRVVRTIAPKESAEGTAQIRQTIHWVAPQDAFLPDTGRVALLAEERTLSLTVNDERREVALRWHSEFTVGTNAVTLAGANYFGLGARFRQDLDAAARHFNAGGAPDLSGGKQDVSQHSWGAVAFDAPNTRATFAVFGDPRNAHGATAYFTMKQPFAYLSATQGLDKETIAYPAGAKFTLDYLVAVYPDLVSPEALDGRFRAWTAAPETGK